MRVTFCCNSPSAIPLPIRIGYQLHDTSTSSKRPEEPTILAAAVIKRQKRHRAESLIFEHCNLTKKWKIQQTEMVLMRISSVLRAV